MAVSEVFFASRDVTLTS